jgi:hypothetical protein
LNVKCVLIFSTIVSETFLILRRNEQDTTKNVFWSSCKVLVILVIFQRKWNVLNIFSKNTEVLNFMKILLPGTVLFRGDGRADMTKLIIVFCNFANSCESGLRLRGHEKIGIVLRNIFFYRKTSIRLELVRINYMI